MSEMQNDFYKNTLNLPQTAFPMKANLPEREPIILKKWDELELYRTLLNRNKPKPTFILHDGPPYANGQIHIGHALNKILKDIVVKSKLLSGFNAPFVPGWDCHGLPIELNVEKKQGKAGVKIDAKQFREKCREYAAEQIDIQRLAFIRLGVMGDWFNPYLTMDYQYEADIIRSLAKIAKKGHLEKGYKPVHWCIDCGSALAEAEVEYKDKTSPAIDVCFKVLNNENLPFKVDIDKQKQVCVVIWTTTPWTLPANQAVALHPKHEYVLSFLPEKNTYLIVVSELLDSVMQRMSIEHYEVLDRCLGEKLEGLLLQHPFYDRSVPIVLGEHVTLETGTGAVHTAPAHGIEDFEIGQKYHLPLENPVGSNGCYLPGTPLLAGLSVLKSNDKVIELLEEHKTLLHRATVQHSYPHCWRHKTPLIFRATQQWFISMEKEKLRQKTLAAIQTVDWIPSWGKARIEGMIENRPDWCISRQRTWGVPIPLFMHKETGELHPDTPALMEKVAVLVEQQGVDAWFDLGPETLLGEHAKDYDKSMDTLDVWFDSGVSHYCVLMKRPELSFPANMYLEGSDQHRGWFHSSLLTSVAMNDCAPYKEILTHGFTVDAKGHKMSKSLGNVVLPEKVVQSKGADVLRLWVASTDYRSEIAISDEILNRVSESYRRIRNTARFLLANLHDFDPAQNQIPANELLALDRYMVKRAMTLQKEIQLAYEEYQFHSIYQKLHHFCSVELGGFYLDIIKDRQYTSKKEGVPRRSAQTALYHIAEALVRWMAPILSFTAEEIASYLPGKREDSIFMTEWYSAFPEFEEKEVFDEHFWETMLALKTQVNKALEEARNKELIGSGLEAALALYVDPNLYEMLNRISEELRFLLITSDVKIYPETERPTTLPETEMPGLFIEVKHSSNEKCVRCWHLRSDVNENADYPGICLRCVSNIAGEGEERLYV